MKFEELKTVRTLQKMKRIAQSIGQISIQWMAQLVFQIPICWIVIYPVG